MNDLPKLPEPEKLRELADQLDEARPLIYGEEVAARMVVAAAVLRRVDEYAQALVIRERERCALICDMERAEFVEAAAQNDGRSSDFAFGSVNSAERIAAAIRKG